MKPNTRSVFSKIFALTISSVALQALGFGYRIFLSRTAGALGMGLFQLVLPFYSVLIALTLSGLTLAVSGLSAAELGAGSPAGARRVLRVCRWIFVLLFALVALVLLLFHGFISEQLLGDGRVQTAILLLLPCLLLTGFENLYKNYFYGVGHVRPPITSELTEQSVRLVAVAVLLLTLRPQDPGDTVSLIVLGMVISEVASVLLLSRFYRSKLVPPIKAHPPVGTLIRRIGAIAVPVTAAGLCNNLLAAANAVLIPQRLMAYGMNHTDAISSYGVLFGMTLPLLALPFALLIPLAIVIVPKLSESCATSRADDVRRKAGKALHTTGLLAFPALAFLLPLGASAGRLLYGQNAAQMYLLPLCLATFFGFYQITTGAILNGIGLQRKNALYTVLGGLLQLGFTWAVGTFGIRSFIVGDLLSAVFIAALNLREVLHALELKFRLRNWVVIPALASVLTFAMVRVTALRLTADGVNAWIALLLPLVLGGVLYLLALRMQGTSLPRYLKTLIPRKASSSLPMCPLPIQRPSRY